MRKIKRLFHLMAVLTALALAAVTPAFATFPGESGHIAYQELLDPNTSSSRSAIFVSGKGQVTFPSPSDDGNQSDSWPAWSPDGSQLAFIRYQFYRSQNDLNVYSLMIVQKDGSLRKVFDASTLFAPNWEIQEPAWHPDGKRISFTVVRPSLPPDKSIYSINIDGTGLTKVVDTFSPRGGTWSSKGDLLYLCSGIDANGQPTTATTDFCIAGADGLGNRLSVDGMPVTVSGNNVVLASATYPRWSPYGQTIVFGGGYTTQGHNHLIDHFTIFTINRDGTDLRALTPTGPDLCPEMNTGPGSIAAAVSLEPLSLGFPLPSPDGSSILAWGSKSAKNGYIEDVDGKGNNGTYRCKYDTTGFGYYTSNYNDTRDPDFSNTQPWDHPEIYSGPGRVDWQPIPKTLTVQVSDGHNNLLDGLKVELRNPTGCTDSDPTGCVIDDHPISNPGEYVFEKTPPPGEYVLRVTLIDRCQGPACTPAFEIRHALNQTDSTQNDSHQDEAAWVEYHFNVIKGGKNTNLLFEFSDRDPSQFNQEVFNVSNVSILSYNLIYDLRGRLSDMANIYFRLRQFVDWVKANLTPDTGPEATVYTFAKTDPFTGKAVPAGMSYQRVADQEIVMSEGNSAFANRDPAGNSQAPMNGEWHEFTHHLYENFVEKAATCLGKDHGPHGDSISAYQNPETCWSMEEGFPEFLPTLAAQDIEHKTTAVYANFGFDFDGMFFKPWNDEENAIAGLLWHLVKGHTVSENTGVIGQDGATHPVAYSGDFVISLKQLWDQMTLIHPHNVSDLRNLLGQQPLIIDLDGDGIADVAPVDIPFLTHGFFPIDTQQVFPMIFPFSSYNYDVNYAQRLNAGAFRDAAVGLTSHRFYDSSGNVTEDLVPRYNIPSTPGANLAVTVLDASGAPVPGATVNIRLQYPEGGVSTISRQIKTGDNDLVHLELPSYFNYPLPDGASLPDCDPTTDYRIVVTLSATVNDGVSPESQSFDNCTYQHQVAAATGPAALSYTLTVPVVGPVNYSLILDTNGTGSGTVNGGGTYGNGQIASVSATPDPGSLLTWRGTGAAECAAGSVLMNSNKSCTAQFTLITNSLILTSAGTGTGAVMGGGEYLPGQTAIVKVTPDPGSVFLGWSGPNAAECSDGSVLMDDDKSCVANLSASYTLSLSTTGTGSSTVVGSGTVTGGGVYLPGDTATVSAVPDAGSSFSGWSGPDAAECATGSVLMNANKSCTATFSLNTYTLTLLTAGSGGGTVSGGGTYYAGEHVHALAQPDASSTFTGWSGPNAAECAAAAPIIMDADKSCTATFELNSLSLTLSAVGPGSATFTNNVNGRGFPTDGVIPAYPGQTVYVGYSAFDGAVFTGWTGPDAAECATGTLVMNADKSCTATFATAYRLSLNTEGDGSGTVTGGGDYAVGQAVTITATANSGSIFGGWSGPDGTECATGSVVMDSDKSCTAEFLLNPVLGLSVGPPNPTILVGDSLPLSAIEALNDGTQRVLSGRTIVPATTLAVGKGPYAAVTADFNGDGMTDLATANINDNTVSILLGIGSGAFASATNIAVGLSPIALAAGDFNNDGRPDLAVVNIDGNSVSILLGNGGAASFTTASTVAVGTHPAAIAVGDFNGDGKQDLAVTNVDNSTVSILLGTGTGSFAVAANEAVGSSPLGVVAADFNGDGKVDLATANVDGNTVSILMGNGDGSFAPAKNVPVGLGPYGIVAGDFNGDGRPDLATSNINDSTSSILLGDGAGGFAAATNVVAGSVPVAIVTGDFNGDGKPDLATANFNDNIVSILFGDGTGSFASSTNVAAGQGPYGIAAGDFNGDGRPDLATANYGNNTVSVLLNSAEVTWTSSDPTVATVDAAGLVSGLNPGTTTITACVTPCAGGGLSSSTTVTVQAANENGNATLLLTLDGSGSGTVTGGGTYNAGQTATVTATPNAVSTFAGWSGPNGAECATGSVVMDADKRCTATFNLTLNTLTVVKGGTGSGAVSSNPAGIDCGADCSEAYPLGAAVTLTATPAAGSIFSGWSGDTDCTDGQVTMNADKSCTATFMTSSNTETIDLSAYQLSVQLAGTDLYITHSVYYNTGNVPIDTVGVSLYFGPSGGGSDIPVASRTITNLQPHGIDTATTVVHLPGLDSPTGTYTVKMVVDPNNQIAETNKANNTRVTTNSFSIGPDLQVLQFQATLTGARIIVSDTEQNIGNQSAGAFSVSYYFTTNTANPSSGTFIGSRDLSGLAGGSGTNGATNTFAVPPNTPEGNYSVCAVADSGNAVTETDEGNNFRCTNTYAVGPDLQVYSLTGTLSGTNIVLSDTEQNTGNLAAGPFSAFFYFTMDKTNPTSGTLIGSRDISGLAGGLATNSGTTTLPVPAGAPAGTYSLCAVSDAGSAVTETNEGNNIKCATSLYKVGADLQVYSLTATTLSGTDIVVSDTEQNIGNQPADPFAVSFYFTADLANPTSGILIGSRSLPGLTGGSKTNSGTTTFSFPSSVPVGTYSICAVTDSGGNVAETNEGNNIKCASATYAVGPDLRVYSFSVIRSGSNLIVSDTEQNIGNQTAGTFTVSFYLSSDAVFDSGDTLLGSRTVAGLSGGSATNSGTHSFPVNGNTGTFYVIAVTDSGAVVAETNEGNNTKTASNTVTLQ